MTSPLSIKPNPMIFAFSDSENDSYGSIPYLSPGSYENYRDEHNKPSFIPSLSDDEREREKEGKNCISPLTFAYDKYRPITKAKLETCCLEQLVQLSRLYKVPVRGDTKEDLIENFLNSNIGNLHSI